MHACSLWSHCWTSHPFTKAVPLLINSSITLCERSYLLTHVVRPRFYKEVKVDISSSNSPLPPRYKVWTNTGGWGCWNFKLIDSDNWALQLDSVQILTLDTKKHQQSAPVAKPRLLFASLPWTTHCFLCIFSLFLLFVNRKKILV